jgi:hypothetical protein
MIVRNCRPSWMAFVSRAPPDAGDHGHAQITSSLIKATAIHAVGACSAGGRSRTRFRSGATNERIGRLDQGGRSSLTRRPTRGVMWSSAASIASNSGVGWPPGTRNARSTIAPCLSWRPLFCGSTPDASGRFLGDHEFLGLRKGVSSLAAQRRGGSVEKDADRGDTRVMTAIAVYPGMLWFGMVDSPLKWAHG